MSILLTGSKGFIGARLMEALKFDVVPVDLGDPLPSEVDGIVHLGAVSRVSAGDRDHIQCLETNVVYTARVLSVRHQWFIHAGSCQAPTNVYGLSKKAAEDYIKLTQPQYVILKLTNVYGPGMPADKLLPRIRAREVENLKPFLPFEAVHVDEVVQEICRFISSISMYKRITKKLCTSVSRTEEELRNVAASY